MCGNPDAFNVSWTERVYALRFTQQDLHCNETSECTAAPSGFIQRCTADFIVTICFFVFDGGSMIAARIIGSVD